MRSTAGRDTSMVGATLAVVLALAWPLLAHHKIPPGRFSDAPTDVQGVVKEVQWRPPHAWIILEVKGAKGEAQVWPLEAASPTVLEKIGMTPDSVRAGDTVKARCRVLTVVRGDYDCILGFLKARDGSVRDWSGGNAPAPADF